MVQWMNTVKRFGLVSRSFHWVMALIIFCLLPVGFFMTEMDFSPAKFEVYSWHKSFGMTVLALGVMRLIWRGAKPVPEHLDTHALWERFLAKTIHGVFYLSFFVMPLSGWVMSSAGQYSVPFFGLFEFPALTGQNEDLYELAQEVHEVSAIILIGGIGLHIMGALKHHVIDRDETLKRMGANLFIGVLGLALLSVPIALMVEDDFLKTDSRKEGVFEEKHEDVQVEAISNSGSHRWIVDHENSEIEFSFAQYGEAVDGEFQRWSAAIVFDPAQLDESSVRVEIDPASIDTGSDSRDEQALSPSWFDVSSYPVAVFESESFERVDANHFIANGVLTLRGIEMPVTFPFRLDFSEKDSKRARADMKGELTLQRLDFGIGQGEWKSTDGIGNAVKVDIDVRAWAGQ